MVHAGMQLFALFLVAVLFTGCKREPTPVGVKRGEFFGRVANVIDGDTIEVVHGSVTAIVNLHGIDAPELQQKFGTEAREYLIDLVKGRPVQVNDLGKDEMGQLVGDVSVEDGIYVNNLSAKMLMHGYAWHFDKYGDYGGARYAEAYGRKGKVGLWADSNAIAPWEWRKANSGKPN